MLVEILENILRKNEPHQKLESECSSKYVRCNKSPNLTLDGQTKEDGSHNIPEVSRWQNQIPAQTMLDSISSKKRQLQREGLMPYSIS